MGAPDQMTAHRALRLREYLDKLPLRTEPERRAYVIVRGMSKGRVSQLLRGGFGERAGVNLATKLGLRYKRAFDSPIGSSFDEPYQPPANAPSPTDQIAPVQARDLNLAEAVRIIAELLLALPEPRREAASTTVKLLASAPDQWTEIAKVLTSFTLPLGGSPASDGSGHPSRKAG